MGRPPKVQNVEGIEQEVNVTTNAQAFSVYRDTTDGKWYVAVVPFNTNDQSVVKFDKAMNFFMPTQIAISDDKYEAFEHFRKIFGNYLFKDE